MPAAVRMRGLSKRYGAIAALTDLSLDVAEGEVFGFLGPNGAGKTTTIRVLLGLLRPSAGSADVLGAPVVAGRAGRRAEVGYLPGELALWPEASGRVTLDFLASLTGRPAVDRANLLDRLALSAADLRRAVRSWSDGMKQKLGIVQALQCRPRLAFLDEPSKGLDPLVQQAFHGIVRDARAGGMTVFLSSHILPEVERTCDRVAMLRAGRLVTVGSVDEVRRLQRRRVTATFDAPLPAERLASISAPDTVAGPVATWLVAQPELPALVAGLATLPLADLVVEPARLEDAFLEHYR